MEITFITIHDLSPHAYILYSSDSIIDILGHKPEEVVGRSAWEYFRPPEAAFAGPLYARNVELDKAAVLAYCWLRRRDGEWVCCECCFSVVYNVMVACTSIYRDGPESQQRAEQAPVIRRLFSSPPNQPRYDMFACLAEKFSRPTKSTPNEPRAAFFLNRFTRSLTIMYATDGIQEIIGISAEQLKGKSFWYCIRHSCLDEAIRCIETAKRNDSIAYLRFRFQDPRFVDSPAPDTETQEAMGTVMDSDNAANNDELSLNSLHTHNDEKTETRHTRHSTSHDINYSHVFPSISNDNVAESLEQHRTFHSSSHSVSNAESRTPSTDSNTPIETDDTLFDKSAPARTDSGDSTDATSSDERLTGRKTGVDTGFEVEAVISCTSDGLVVCLRRAHVALSNVGSGDPMTSKLAAFAVPWSAGCSEVARNTSAGVNSMAHTRDVCGDAHPPMTPISDIAIIAWAMVGTNGSVAQHTRGTPSGEAVPEHQKMDQTTMTQA